MKRKIISFVSLLATTLLCAFCMFSCDPPDYYFLKVTANVESKEDILVIQLIELDEPASLMQVMRKLELDKKFEFEDKDGMVTKIGNKANTANSYWMLYTSDEEMSDTSWRSYTYNDEIFGLGNFGANNLTAVKGETYIWVYESF